MHKEHTKVGFNYRSSNQFAKVAYSRPGRLPATSARRVVIDERQRRASADATTVSCTSIAVSGSNGLPKDSVFTDKQIDHVIELTPKRARVTVP
ncbi:MAG: hypothetical protein ACLQCU_17105 [Acidimicrobiales bacterium]|jgi:hypothetical protein